jgi:hypothetical protein
MAEMNKKFEAHRQIQPKSQSQKQGKGLSNVISEKGRLFLYVINQCSNIII